MKLKELLFETDGESNEEAIANIVLGLEDSADPEDQEETKLQKAKFDQTDLPTPSFDEIPIGVLGDESSGLNEGKKTEDEEKLKLFNSVLSQSNVFVFQSKNKKAFRLKPNEDLKDKLIHNEISKEDFVNALNSEKEAMFTGFLVKEYPKGHPESVSRSFITYAVTDPEPTSETYGTTIKIVLASGGNKGHTFEKEVQQSILNKKGPIWNALMCYLVQTSKITKIEDIKDYSFTTKSTNVKRPFASSITNIGPQVADLTIILKNGTSIYVSLKGEKGDTVSNNGFKNSFQLRKEETEEGKEAIKVKVVERQETEIDKFLNALGVDKQKIARGLEAAGNGMLQNGLNYPYPQEVQSISSGEEAMNYIASQIGYGYIYFRRNQSGGFTIKDIKSEEDTNKLIGKFEGGTINYPYFVDEKDDSRQCSVFVDTDTARFKVEIRTSKTVTSPYGIINSLQCNLKVTKIKNSEVFNCELEDWREELAGLVPVQESRVLNLKNWLY